MQVELNSEVALSAANALLSHLRKNPEAAMSPARDLAATFGLDEAFVAQVLQGINANRRPEARPVQPRQSSFHGLGNWIKSLWARMSSRPVLFVVLSSVFGIVLAIGAAILSSALLPASESGQVGSSGNAIPTNVLVAIFSVFAIIGGTFLLHLGVYFQHRRVRHALYGGLFFFLAMVAVLAVLFVIGDPKQSGGGPPISPIVLFSMGVVGVLMIALVYTGLGALASVLGGWTRFKLQEKAEGTMSRQDLLERYFELQSRLQKSAYPRASSQEPALYSSPLVLGYRKYQFATNLGLGLLLNTITILALSASGIVPGETNQQVNFWFFVLVFIGISEWIIFVLQGFLSVSAWRAFLGAVSFQAGSLIVRLMPFARDAYDETTMSLGLAELVSTLVNALISGGGYLAAVVQKRAIRESNLLRNDQATLLAEMVRIQWKLSNEAASVCVLVVDAAKSSEMKALADPLVVEYTFREYQEWIEAICNERGGRVHSTAGDGAVVAFSTCQLALSAARRMQSDLFRFNKEVNRLTQQFRLRIGLHTGEIIGDINEVQFTEVIDIAAHIESACPIGGIAATDDVVQRLPDEKFVDLSVTVDGHQVYLVESPTEFH